MVYKILLITLLFFFNIVNAKIIYDKNNITISDIEFKEYSNLYLQFYNLELSEKKVLKNLILLKKTINYLEKNSPEYMEALSLIIKKENNGNLYENKFLLDFIKFLKIRNEFITEFFKNEFLLEDLRFIFNTFEELNIPISRNECLTIDRIENLKNEDYFLDSFYFNLKNNSRIFKTQLNNVIYHACMEEEYFREIENYIIEFIREKTQGKFEEFVYQIKF